MSPVAASAVMVAHQPSDTKSADKHEVFALAIIRPDVSAHRRKAVYLGQESEVMRGHLKIDG